MSIKNFYIIFVLTALFLFSSAGTAKAAALNISLDRNTVAIGSQINAIVKIDSEGLGINAAQATIRFSKDIIQVVKFDKSNSVFNFWLQEPTFSNDDGRLDFIGGTTTGYSGSSLQVLKITFKVIGSGKGTITFTDAAVTASDGSGTNVLSKTLGAEVSSVPSGQVETVAGPVPLPTQITRQAEPAQLLPTKPILAVSLYPDSAKWYNISSNFGASWNLSGDIVEVATALNKDPAFAPFKSEGLFDNKMFSALDDGIWYLHVRFKNNIGWGPATHWRIGIDTAPPIAFQISSIEGLATDMPNPTLNFESGDAFSGIDYYEIRIDDGDLIKTDKPSYILPLQKPGKHLIKVAIVDKANNKAENNIEIEILPIEMPLVASINKKIILGTDDFLTIRGSAIPDANIIITVEDKNKFLILQDKTKADFQGKWEFILDKELRRGDYFVSVTAQDSRGALSFPTELIKVSFIEKPIISLFGLDITLRDLVIILIVAGVLAALWFYRKTLLRLAKSQREAIVINRDLKNAFSAVKKDLGEIAGIIKKDVPVGAKELEFDAINKKISDTLDKIEKYLSRDIEELK